MVTVAGYLDFIRNNMQVPISALPDNAPAVLMSLAISVEIVNPALKLVAPHGVPSLGYVGPNIYELAVYNLAGDNLINFAPDQQGQTFFANARKSYGTNSFVAGVISATADEGTSESLMVPDVLKGLTMANLQNLKTPWGRTYLSFAMQFGTLWGMS